MEKIIGIATLILLLSAQGLSADSFPTAQGKADNKNHFVCWVPWASTGRPAPAALNNHLRYAASTLYYQTGARVITYPCVPLVDVFLDDDLRDNRLLGQRRCRVWPLSPGNVCIESSVRINPYAVKKVAQIKNLSESLFEQHVWCHEYGHSFGLQHHGASGDCMTNLMETTRSYSSHHLTHIRTL